MDVQELVGIVPWTFIAQICNLFLQVYLIKRFLFKPINEVLAKRKAMADAQLQDAAKAKAQRNASIQSEEILKQANAQAVAIKEKAESDIAQEKRKAVNEIKDEIGGMAVDIAGKVIQREISEEDHKKLIDDFIANVGEAS